MNQIISMNFAMNLEFLVWQDLCLRTPLYPANKKFLNSVEKEVTFQINRLKHHPCIILWCGNNEVASAWLGWGWNEKFPQSVWSKDYKCFPSNNKKIVR